MPLKRLPGHFLDHAEFAAIAALLHALGATTTAPTLTQLAATTALSARRLRELFVAWADVSLESFVEAHDYFLRAGDSSAHGSALFAAAHALQLRGANRLGRRTVVTHLRPSSLVREQAVDLVWGVTPSPLGTLAVVESQHGICRLEIFDNDRALALRLAKSFKFCNLQRDDHRARQLALAVFGGARERSAPSPLRLHLCGSQFDLEVWQALLAKDCSDVLAYGELAAVINRPQAVRAVASAVGRNRLSWIVPCHHVLARNGLGGYHWGLDRKRALLIWESLALPYMR